MDPNLITDQQWIEYRHLVSLLWFIPLLGFVLVTSLLLRFGILPSLWNSRGEEVARSDAVWANIHGLVVKRHGTWPLSQWMLLLGALGAVAALLAVLFIAQGWARDVIGETFGRWWI